MFRASGLGVWAESLLGRSQGKPEGPNGTIAARLSFRHIGRQLPQRSLSGFYWFQRAGFPSVCLGCRAFEGSILLGFRVLGLRVI